MSSQRVVSFKLSAAQRARVHQVVRANQAIANRRIARAREQMLMELDRLAGQASASSALPSAAEVDAAFRATTDIEAAAPAVEKYRTQMIAASNEKAARARTGLTRDLDSAASKSLGDLLARLPSDDIPAAVAAAADKVRAADGPGGAAALETVRRLVKAEVLEAERRARIRSDLDRADAILGGVVADRNGLSARLRGTADLLAERVAAAETEYRSGAMVESGALVVDAAALHHEFERDQHEAHALKMLRTIWEGLGYTLATDDQVPGFLARKPGEGRGVWVGPVGDSTKMTQVGVEGEIDLGRSAADVHDSLCSAAGEVEALAAVNEMEVRVHEIEGSRQVSETLAVSGNSETRTKVLCRRTGGKR